MNQFYESGEPPFLLRVVTKETYMIKHISASSYNTFHGCGMQYYYRYICGKKNPPGLALLRGSSTHTGIRYVNETKRETGKEPPIDEVADSTRDAFTELIKQQPLVMSKEEKADKNNIINSTLKTSIALASAYTRKVSPKNKTFEIIEEKLMADIGMDLPILGYMDLVSNKKIIDIKTSGKAWPVGREHTEIQPVFYDILCAENNIAVVSSEFVVLTKYKTKPRKTAAEIMWDDEANVNVDIRKTLRDNNDIEILKRRIDVMIRSIEAGIFIPAQESEWRCSPKFCGYHHLCPHSK